MIPFDTPEAYSVVDLHPVEWRIVARQPLRGEYMENHRRAELHWHYLVPCKDLRGDGISTVRGRDEVRGEVVLFARLSPKRR